MADLTRKEFYQLAIECRETALDLARNDQHRVVPAQCRTFNAWLRKLQGYDRLRARIGDLTPARPITRWHMMGVVAVLWFLVVFLVGQELGEASRRAMGFVLAGALILIYFLPERLYGTTIELLEGKVLRVVETMEQILLAEEMQFTEAAFFQVKENLQVAHHELREQIRLVH